MTDQERTPAGLAQLAFDLRSRFADIVVLADQAQATAGPQTRALLAAIRAVAERGGHSAAHLADSGPARTPPGQDGAAGSGRVVLLVDDDPAQCQVVALALATAGWRIQVAAGFSQASAILRADETLDLMITELILPDGSGWDLIAHARARQPALPVIVVTGSTLAPTVAEPPRERQGIVHLAKPVSGQRLTQLAALCARPARPA